MFFWKAVLHYDSCSLILIRFCIDIFLGFWFALVISMVWDILARDFPCPHPNIISLYFSYAAWHHHVFFLNLNQDVNPMFFLFLVVHFLQVLTGIWYLSHSNLRLRICWRFQKNLFVLTVLNMYYMNSLLELQCFLNFSNIR